VVARDHDRERDARDHLNPVALFVVALGVFNVGRAWWRERRPQPATALEQLDSLNASPATLRPVNRMQERAAAFVYSGSRRC